MNITEQVAQEIFSNPNDLSFGIIKDPHKEKFGVMISRGPGINFKHLIDDEYAGFPTIADAADAIGNVLNNIVDLYPQEEKKLTKEGVCEIVAALKVQQYFGTYLVY